MTNRSLKSLATLAALVAFALPATARKNREWQNGKVLDPRNSPYYTESAVDAPYGDSQLPVAKVAEPFLIEGQASAYFAQEELRWQKSKPANLKVNATVKFAVEGRRLYVIDGGDKEHRMKITRVAPRTPGDGRLLPGAGN